MQTVLAPLTLSIFINRTSVLSSRQDYFCCPAHSILCQPPHLLVWGPQTVYAIDASWNILARLNNSFYNVFYILQPSLSFSSTNDTVQLNVTSGIGFVPLTFMTGINHFRAHTIKADDNAADVSYTVIFICSAGMPYLKAVNEIGTKSTLSGSTLHSTLVRMPLIYHALSTPAFMKDELRRRSAIFWRIFQVSLIHSVVVSSRWQNQRKGVFI